MLKYTALLQQIECLMDDPAAVPMEKIAELAKAYIEACNWVNDKTLLCVSSLRQGNASEALRLCRKLDLLENYRTLVFGEYKAWISAALTFGDVAIPAFNQRLIDELNKAQVSMGPVEEVLKSHRILAMTHSPLKDRIMTLRKLVEFDPQNTGWINELRDYENARLDLIFDELSSNISYGDFESLLKEVRDSKWSVEIPVKIKKRIAIIQQDYQKKNYQKQVDQYKENLKEAADKLQKAYNDDNFEEAKKCCNLWDKACKDCESLGITVSEEMLQSIVGILSWISHEQKSRDRLEEFDAKVAAADRELKHSMSVEKCQRLLQDLTRAADEAGRKVPERFQNFLDKLIANEERQVSRHNRFVTSIFAIILLAVIGVVSFGVYEFVQWYRFNSLLDNLSKYQLAVSKNRDLLPEAYQFVQNLESSGYQLAIYPKVQKDIAYIKKLYEDDKVRHEDWKLLHDKIERSVKQGIASSHDEINELEKLSILKEEKDAFAILKKYNDGLLSDRSKLFVLEQNEKLQKIQQTTDALLTSDEAGNVVKLREIETQIMQVKQAFADYAFNNPEVQNEARNFESKSSDLLSTVQSAIKESISKSSLGDKLENLASSISSKSDYVNALQSIIDNDNSAYSTDFKAVVQEQESWGRAYAWNDFINQNRSVFRGGSTRSTIQLKDFCAQWNAMSFKPREMSTVKKVNGRIPYYQSIIDCNASASLKPLKELCYLFSRIEFWYYETPDGKRYYFNRKPDVDKGKLRLEYMDSVSTLSENRIAVDKSTPIDPLNNRVFCQKIANLLSMINDNTRFTDCGIRILDVISQDTSLNDPVIKCQFMMTALECFTKSDKIIQENFGTYLQQLDSVDVKNGNPFMPENESSIRVEAERMLGRLKGISKSVDDAHLRNQQLAQSFNADIIQPVGWLDKDGSQWTVKGISSKAAGELYIVKQSGLVSVGTVKNTVVKMKSIPDGKRGFPVFMIKTFKP